MLTCKIRLPSKYYYEVAIETDTNIFRVYGFYASKIVDFDAQNKSTPSSTLKFVEMTLISFNEF